MTYAAPDPVVDTRTSAPAVTHALPAPVVVPIAPALFEAYSAPPLVMEFVALVARGSWYDRRGPGHQTLGESAIPHDCC